MEPTTWEDARTKLAKSTTLEFEQWWAAYYGDPSKYNLADESECEEFYTRKYFAWQGWSAARRDILTPYELLFGVFNYCVYILEQIWNWVWYDILKRPKNDNIR